MTTSQVLSVRKKLDLLLDGSPVDAVETQKTQKDLPTRMLKTKNVACVEDSVHVWL